MGGTAKLDGGRRPYLQRLFIQVGDLPCPNDVWNQGKDDFIFLVLHVALGEEVFQDRNLCQPGNAVERPDVLIFQNTAQDVDLSFFEPNFMLDLALADDRLADATNI